MVLLGSSKVKDKPPSSSTVSCAQAAHFTGFIIPHYRHQLGMDRSFLPSGSWFSCAWGRGIFLSQSTAVVDSGRYQNSLIRPTKSAKNKQNLKHIWEVISHFSMAEVCKIWNWTSQAEGSARPASGRFSHDMPRKITGEWTAVIHVHHVSKQA